MSDLHVTRVRRIVVSGAFYLCVATTLIVISAYEFLQGSPGKFEPVIVAFAAAFGVGALALAWRQFNLLFTFEKQFTARTAHFDDVLSTFNAALNNMAQGIALYDSGQRILLANRRYAQMYGLEPDDLQPGMTMEEILRKRAGKGVFVGDDPDHYVEGRVSAMTSPTDEHQIERYAGGRVIEKSRKPIPGGGWVSVHEDVTDRRRAEEKVREVNTTFDATLDHMPQGLALYDSKQHIVLANRNYAHLYGLSPEEIRPGMSMRDILRKRVEKGVYVGDDPDVYVDQRIGAMETPQDEQGVEHYADGRVIEKSRKPMPGGGWLSVHEDVTNRKRNEERIVDVLATFDATIENMPHGVALFDKEQRIVLANHRYAEMYGLEPGDIQPGMSMKEMLQKRVDKGVFIGVDPSNYVEERVNAMAAPTNEHSVERYSDGRVIQKSRKPMPGGGWLSVHEDITHRQRAEDRIAEVLATFEATMANMPQGVALFDKEQVIVLANARYAEMYGLERDDVAPGTAMQDMLRKRAEKGVYMGLDPAKYVAERVSAMANPSHVHNIERYADGRVIEKSRKPMPDGGWLSVHDDITERQRAEDRIAWLAHHDALTQLVNRVVLQEKIEEAFSRVRRDSEQFAILLLDLDDFKIVNDTMGHPIGDKLLQSVADRLRATVRDVDLVARIGGDEFAIVLHAGIEAIQSADGLAQRLMDAICAPYEIDGLPLQICLSIGAAIAPLDGADGGTLLQNADLALYQAKAAGRRCVRFFNAEMDKALRSERSLETSLRQALAANEFEVHYQAVASVHSGRTIGMEALVRWRHPQFGMVPPDRFIKLAEKTGMINALGEWVLQTSCKEAATWPDGIKVAVNLSPAQFKSGDLVSMVRNALEESGLPSSRLTLEITESTLLEKTDDNLTVLHALKKLGVAIALDDFGTGYSSLSYLKTIPFDVIKIDRSFVMEMETNPRSAQIIAGIVGLSRSLNFTTVAEGIETPAQFELVRAAGCTAVQGYLFSRPKPAHELTFDEPKAGEARNAA